MSHISWLEPHIEYLLRILLGTGLGAAIGFERDLHGRPAGLRTHAIVALGAATFMVVSTRFVYFQHYAAGDSLSEALRRSRQPEADGFR